MTYFIIKKIEDSKPLFFNGFHYRASDNKAYPLFSFKQVRLYFTEQEAKEGLLDLLSIKGESGEIEKMVLS